MSIHSRRDISNAEKTVRHSLKDGSARAVIEGLSQSGDQYLEAIASLKARYDRPKAPSLKDGSGKDGFMIPFNNTYAPSR